MVVAANVVKRVQYIPVADATAGCMSIYTIIELKMVPGAMPAKAEQQAALNATITSLPIVRASNF